MSEEPGKGGDEKDVPPTGGTGSLSGDGYQAEDVFEGAEPWDPVETKIVLGSLLAAAIFLVIFAILIHVYILS